jgi:hypothetical protein
MNIHMDDCIKYEFGYPDIRIHPYSVLLFGGSNLLCPLRVLANTTKYLISWSPLLQINHLGSPPWTIGPLNPTHTRTKHNTI